MPTYNFINKKTGEEFSEFMTMSEKDEYLEKNPHLEQTLAKPPIISGLSSLKPDKGFREFLSEINRKNAKRGVKINDYGG